MINITYVIDTGQVLIIWDHMMPRCIFPEDEPTPEMFAEYRERPEQRQCEPWEIEPPTYWGQG